MIAKESIFREYDIRGVVGVDFDKEFAWELGQAFAELVLRTFQADPSQPSGRQSDQRKVAVGYDCRLSSGELNSSLTQGLLDGGVDVISTGLGPTPQLYYSVVSKKLWGGIQITGSHNPGDQNGFKMMLGEKTLSGDDIQRLRQQILSRQAGKYSPPSNAKKSSVQPFDARTAYIEELVNRSKPYMGNLRKIRLVVDAGNGVGGLVGPEMLRRLGCEVIELYTAPDGRFPNHHPDPTVLENIRELRERVIAEKASVGIAWDGDADRIGVVDEKGDPLYGDILLVLYGRQLLKEVPYPIIIGDVKCSEIMFQDLRQRGAETVMAKTGHSLIKAELKKLHAHLAGEMSGHMFFSHRYFGFDDALHASARLVEILSNSNASLSELLSDLPKMVSTPEIRVECPENLKFEVAERAKTAFSEFETNPLDGVRIRFPHGWGLVRASNTQPALVMRFEAETEQQLEEYRKLVEERIKALRAELS